MIDHWGVVGRLVGETKDRPASTAVSRPGELGSQDSLSGGFDRALTATRLISPSPRTVRSACLNTIPALKH